MEKERMWSVIFETSDEHKQIVKKCQENIWIKNNGVAFYDDPFFEQDSPYVFARTETIEGLKAFFEHGNWAIRNGILYNDLLFINQVNGGDEWWTLKYDKFKREYVSFESITFRFIIERGEFEKYIKRLENATIEQCKNLKY